MIDYILITFEVHQERTTDPSKQIQLLSVTKAGVVVSHGWLRGSIYSTGKKARVHKWQFRPVTLRFNEWDYFILKNVLNSRNSKELTRVSVRREKHAETGATKYNMKIYHKK